MTIWPPRLAFQSTSPVRDHGAFSLDHLIDGRTSKKPEARATMQPLADERENMARRR
jgi:hypothetical protein